MFTDRLDGLPAYPFPRLRALLKDVPPGGGEENMRDLSLGEPQHAFPPFVGDIILATQKGFNRYPPMAGAPELLGAIAAWLTRRYALAAGAIDENFHLLVLSGTREGLFNVILANVPSRKQGQTSAVLIPNPFYQCYAGAAAAIGAEAIYLAANATNGFLPSFDRLDGKLLRRTGAVFLCSPSNPQGAVAGKTYLMALIRLARVHDFLLVLDECYAEIYDGEAPPGGLACAEAVSRADGVVNDDVFSHVLVFHSLSKRSNLPGLRSGFCAGDKRAIARFKNLRDYGGASTPLPIQAAAAACWRDEQHVVENRSAYRRKIALAETILAGKLGFYRPAGGFFLWLDVGEGEKAALQLWREAGVKVLPGRYLGRDDSLDEGGNPGARYIRVALVKSEDETTDALTRLARIIG
jgi:aspartate/methionine/tyrosine aminotransferase